MNHKHSKMIHQQEILEDILSRLPAKSIGRFRCVSKPWKALLSQSQFIKTHLNRIKHFSIDEQSLILITSQCSSLYTAHLKNSNHMYDEIAVSATSLCSGDYKLDSIAIVVRNVASCDGLTLFEDEDWTNRRTLLLVNPTTKEFKLLPKSPYTPASHVSIYTMSGVGYDSATDDHKVVCVYFYNRLDDSDMCVDVYSVKKGTWKKSVSSPQDYSAEFHTPGVFVDGHIHWLISRTSDESSVIVSFHIGEEKLREVPLLPTMFEGKSFRYNLLTLEGCLCMSASGYHQTHVWVMKEYGVKESWTKFTVVNSEEVMALRPLCLLGQEQVVLFRTKETVIDDKVVVYNLKNRSCKDIVVQGIPDKFSVAGTFIESLVSPHCSVEGSKLLEKN